MLNNAFSYVSHYKNPHQTQAAYDEQVASLKPADYQQAFNTISKWPAYQATPLVNLDSLAETLSIGKILYKDESQRFHLKSFKALGGSYAVHCVANAYKQQHGSLDGLVVCTATDGNHGRSVAWGAQLLGLPCHIFIHAHVSQERANIMANFGATIHRIDGNYDDSLVACSNMADKQAWQIISDTSWEGYMQIPKHVMAGYGVMTQEITCQLNGDKPSHIIIQAGCGGMAGAVIANLWHHWQDQMPHIILVESYMSDCVYQSLKDDGIKLVPITEETLMAGLSCGEVSHLAWPLLRQHVAHVITIDDENVAPVMQYLGSGKGTASAVALEAGECSASGITALMTIMRNSELAQQIGIDANSSVLVFGTEGATDEALYKRIMST